MIPFVIVPPLSLTFVQRRLILTRWGHVFAPQRRRGSASVALHPTYKKQRLACSGISPLLYRLFPIPLPHLYPYRSQRLFPHLIPPHKGTILSPNYPYPIKGTFLIKSCIFSFRFRYFSTLQPFTPSNMEETREDEKVSEGIVSANNGGALTLFTHPSYCVHH
jgi:hypothetical protein